MCLKVSALDSLLICRLRGSISFQVFACSTGLATHGETSLWCACAARSFPYGSSTYIYYIYFINWLTLPHVLLAPVSFLISSTSPTPKISPSIMNLKFSALIICSTLFSFSTSLPQDQGTDELKKIRAKLLASAVEQPVPTLEVIPVDRREYSRTVTDVNLPEKRGKPKVQPIHLYVCDKPLWKGRCELFASNRGFCCTCCIQISSPALPSHIRAGPSQATRGYSLSWWAIDLTVIIPDTLKNGWNNDISSIGPDPLTKCTFYE